MFKNYSVCIEMNWLDFVASLRYVGNFVVSIAIAFAVVAHGCTVLLLLLLLLLLQLLFFAVVAVPSCYSYYCCSCC